MSDRTRVGLLGAGYILDSHAQALLEIPDVTLHAVCDASRGRAAAAAAKYRIPHVFDSIDALVASDCDVVHVLLPPALHIGPALSLVGAGKSVFLEKPMGLDSAGCDELCKRAAEKGVAVGVNHNFLFSPRYEALRASLKNGELGRIDQLAVTWHFAQSILQFGPFDSWMLAAPANMLFEIGPHLGAFVLDLVGPPEIVSAVAGDPIELPGEQTVFRQWIVVGSRSRNRGAAVHLHFARACRPYPARARAWWKCATRFRSRHRLA